MAGSPVMVVDGHLNDCAGAGVELIDDVSFAPLGLPAAVPQGLDGIQQEHLQQQSVVQYQRHLLVLGYRHAKSTVQRQPTAVLILKRQSASEGIKRALSQIAVLPGRFW